MLDGVYRCAEDAPIFEHARAPSGDDLRGLLDRNRRASDGDADASTALVCGARDPCEVAINDPGLPRVTASSESFSVEDQKSFDAPVRA